MEDAGAPISWIVLAEHTPVYSAEGDRIGTVKRVLADAETDIFDGLIIDTHDGDRFVDGDHVGDLYERAVVLDLSAADARHMPDPTPNPATMEPTPDDVAGETTQDSIANALKRAWDRISGNY